MIINVIQLIVSYFLIVKISSILFPKDSCEKIVSILLLFFFPGVIYCTFIYGVIPSFMFSLISCYFFLEYLKTKQKKQLVLCGIPMGIAYVLKPNALLIIISIIIIIMMTFDKKIKNLLLSLLVFVFFSFLPNNLLQSH